MKKNAVIIMCLIFALCGCSKNPEQLKLDVTELKQEISELESKKKILNNDVTAKQATLNNLIIEEKIKKDEAIYIMKIKIGIDRFVLDIDNKMKDAMNEFEFEIPVSKEYYDELEIGDRLNEKMRIGSLVLKGSYGKQYVEVVEKRIE